MRDLLVASGVAVLVTAPILFLHFGEASVAGLVTNLVAAPVLGGFCVQALVLGAALLPVSRGAAEFLFGCASWLVESVEPWIERMGRAAWVLDPGAEIPGLVALGGTLIGLALVARAWRGRLLALAGLCLLLGCWPSFRDSSPFRAEFLDVGQGDGILVAGSGSRGAMLVDSPGGQDPLSLVRRLHLPALVRAGVGRLDWVVATHPEWDHFGGLLGLPGTVRIETFVSNGEDAEGDGWGALVDVLQREEIARENWVRGLRRSLGGIDVRVLHPPTATPLEGNDASLVLGVRYGATRILLAGDIERAGEAELVTATRDLGAAILKVPHHGSRTSSTRRFLEAVRPAVAVAQLGRGNRFGFPAPAVRARYSGVGAKWLGTDVAGSVEVVSDGQLMRLRLCRDEEPGAPHADHAR